MSSKIMNNTKDMPLIIMNTSYAICMLHICITMYQPSSFMNHIHLLFMRNYIRIHDIITYMTVIQKHKLSS